MKTNETTPVEATAEVVKDADDVAEATGSLVDALFDVGTAWAEYGLGYGKQALESTAKVLETTAKTLEVLQERFKKDASTRVGNKAA